MSNSTSPINVEDNLLLDNANSSQWAVEFVEKAEEILSNEGVLHQNFETILKGTKGSVNSTLVANKRLNRPMNRDLSVVPYDSSRVLLREDGVGNADQLKDDFTIYINASHIESINRSNAYVACQAPTKKTVNDHWLMIWEYKVQVIVMLTNCVTGIENTCWQYWPGNTDVKHIYGNVEVKLIDVQTSKYFTERTFKIYKRRNLNQLLTKRPPKQTIRQIHLHHWPEMHDPQRLTIFHDFFKAAKSSIITFGKAEQPVLVHCSNGGFRTGVFIALDLIVNSIPHLKTNTVGDAMKRVGLCRQNIISHKDQLQFIYEYMIFYLKLNIIPKEPAPREPSPNDRDSAGSSSGQNVPQAAGYMPNQAMPSPFVHYQPVPYVHSPVIPAPYAHPYAHPPAQQ